jgi:hypothetical protein
MAVHVASVTPPARAYGKTIGVWGWRVLHASGAGICIFMNRLPSLKFEAGTSAFSGELVRGEITLQHLDA